MLSLKTARGFTLIELVVVVAIIGIVSSIVIVSLSNQRALRETDRGAHEFGSHLREGQNYALSGRSSSLTEENCYYALQITSATAYSLVNYYRAGGNCDTFNTIATFNLQNGVQFSGVAGYPLILAFLLPRAEVYSNATGPLAALGAAQLIGFTKSGQTSYVCLYPSGRIEQRGTVASCP